MTKLLTLGLKGVATVGLVDGGRMKSAPVVTRNLWLDQGLDNMVLHPICDLFAVAVKGTGTSETTEDLTATTNTYSIPNGSSTLTRTAGSRNFTADDVGKLIRFVGGREFKINGFTSATVVSVEPVASPAVTNLKATLYSVHQVELEEEVGRSDDYSSVAGENSTATAGNVRTFKRTFVFPTEDVSREVVPDTETYSQTGTTVTRETGHRGFLSGDIGKTILFENSGQTAVITAVGGLGTTATVDVSQTVAVSPIELTIDADLTEAVTGTYSRSGTTVTRATGTRDFTLDDVGKIIYFGTDNVEATIGSFTDAANVVVDVSGTLAAQAITLYGFTDYGEIGFSHSMERGILTSGSPNLNIRVKLSSLVRAYVSTPLTSSDQLKVTYECDLTVVPDTSTAGNLGLVISDPSNAMSGNKTGNYVIETFSTSVVSTSGETDVSLVDLEPYYEGFAGLSLNTDALAPLTGKVRENSLVTTPLTGAVYTDGDFTRVYTGTFGLNDAVNNNWRSLMIVDPESKLAALTFLYAVNQKKDGEHTFTISFRKTWGRDLS